MPSLSSPLQRRFYAGLVDRYERRSPTPPYALDVYLTRMTHHGPAGIAEIIDTVGPVEFAVDLTGKTGSFPVGTMGDIRTGVIVACEVRIVTPCASADPSINVSVGVDPSATNLWNGQPLTALQGPAGTLLGGAPLGAPFPHTITVASRLRVSVTPGGSLYTVGALSVTLRYQ